MDDYYTSKIKYQIKAFNKRFPSQFQYDGFSEIKHSGVYYFWAQGLENKACLTYEFIEDKKLNNPEKGEYIMLDDLILRVIEDRPMARMIIVERVN